MSSSARSSRTGTLFGFVPDAGGRIVFELCIKMINDIVAAYGAIYRGVVQFYLHAGDVYRLERLRWTMETSLLRTLAAKHDSTATKMAARHRATVETPHGPRICHQAVRTRGDNRKPLVAQCGGIPLKRHTTAVITDRAPGRGPRPRKELITRLLRNRCELCDGGGQV